MTARAFRLLPLLAVAAILLAGSATGLALAGGDASAPEAVPVTSNDIAPGECSQVHNVDACPGGPDIAAACIEGSETCDDTIDVPVDSIADCQYDPCYDTGILPDGLTFDERCKALADDLVACIADPDGPVSSVPVSPEKPPDTGPITSGDDIPPDECSLVHNVDACESPPNDGNGAAPEPEQPAPDECSVARDVPLCEDLRARETAP